MKSLAKALRPMSVLVALASLMACDHGATAPTPSPGPDTLQARSGTNDALTRADELEKHATWIPVHPLAPGGQLLGSAWYVLNLDSGLTYSILLKDSSFTGASMDLFDADSSLLRSSTPVEGTTGSRLVGLQYESTRAERVYLVVFGPVPSVVSIRVEVLPGKEQGPDAYEDQESPSESPGGPSLYPDSQWINRTLHRTAGGVMESGDRFQISVDSGKLYTLHLLSHGNVPAVDFLPWGMLPIDTVWTHVTSKNTTVSTVTFAAYRNGTFYLLVRPSGPDFKPVPYRIAATSHDGIPARIYPDHYEPDDTPESASLLFLSQFAQVRTLHLDRGRSDVDDILLVPPSDDSMLLEIHDSLQALMVEAFHPDGTPAALVETVTGSVRTFLVPGQDSPPIRLHLTDRLGFGVRYRLSLRER